MDVRHIHQEFANLNYNTCPPPRNFQERSVSHPTACKSNNIPRNRYKDVLPNEDTRVKLKNSENDYINANYVTDGGVSYICCQAPIPNTFADFWMMLLEQNCSVICSLNKPHEKGKGGKVKGHMYWPDTLLSENVYVLDNKQNIYVQLMNTYKFCQFEIVMREFQIRNSNFATRTIYQLHYLGWPDNGVPSSTLPIRELTNLVKHYQLCGLEKGINGPCVIHCSAGIGRAGCFLSSLIAINSSFFQQLKGTESSHFPDVSLISQFNVMDIVLSLRKQRNRGMVQTVDQYEFIYRVIVDLLQSPDAYVAIKQPQDMSIEAKKASSSCNSRKRKISATNWSPPPKRLNIQSNISMDSEYPQGCCTDCDYGSCTRKNENISNSSL